MLDQHSVGVTTIGEQAGLGGVGAHIFQAAITLHTRPTTPWGVHHDGSKFGVHAGDFVTEHHG